MAPTPILLHCAMSILILNVEVKEKGMDREEKGRDEWND
jgi:hypothetical protein